MFSASTAPGAGHGHRVVLEARQVQVAKQQPAVGVGVVAHSPVVRRGEAGDVRQQRTGGGEQLLRPVRPHPLHELPPVLVVAPHVRDRHLVRPPGALNRLAVHELRPGPPLGCAQHERRPARPLRVAVDSRPPLDVVDLGDDRVKRAGELLVHELRVVALHGIDVVTVTSEQRLELVRGDPGRDRGVGDLVPVEVQDRQHRPVGHRVEELVGVPRAGQRPGLRLAVADHAGDEQVGVVERRAVGVRERVPELAALVDGAGRLRRHVGGDAAGERELAEELAHPLGVLGDRRVPLGVGALQVRVRDHPGPAVPGAGDVDDVQVPVPDHPVEVRVDEVEPRRGAPVPEQPRLDVLRPELLGEQRVVEQVDLPDRQVVGRAPPGVDEVKLGGRQRPGFRRGHAGSSPHIPNECVMPAGGHASSLPGRRNPPRPYPPGLP